MNFGVSNLGQSDLFLGHDWLRYHNPEINWETKILKFTRCPGACRKEEIGEELEEEELTELEEGDCLTNDPNRRGRIDNVNKNYTLNRNSQHKQRYADDRRNTAKILSPLSRRI